MENSYYLQNNSKITSSEFDSIVNYLTILGIKSEIHCIWTPTYEEFIHEDHGYIIMWLDQKRWWVDNNNQHATQLSLQELLAKLRELILIKAKEDYPIGTRYHPAHMSRNNTDDICTVTNLNSFYWKGNYLIESEGSYCKNGHTLTESLLDVSDCKWATIIKDEKSIPTEETNLQKAKRLYPLNTIYVGLIYGKQYAVTRSPRQFDTENIDAGEDYIYYNGEWAQIVSTVYNETSNNSHQETNLEKAARLYPIGTRYRGAVYGDIEKAYKSAYEYSSGNIEVGTDYVFNNGKWAEIVSADVNTSYIERYSSIGSEELEQILSIDHPEESISLELKKPKKIELSINKKSVLNLNLSIKKRTK